MFILLFLSSQTRNKSRAWRPLGFIPNVDNFYSKAQYATLFTTEDKILRFQQMCDAVFTSLVESQKLGALDNITLRLGPYEKEVNLKCPVAFIIGDAQGGDIIAGRSPYYGRSASRICRSCNATYDNQTDTGRNACQRLLQAPIKMAIERGDTELLDKLGQKNCFNAFMKLDYGGSPFGIFLASCPPEPLHQLEKGPVADAIYQLYNGMLTKPELSRLDDIVTGWCKLPSQCLMRSYRCKFPRLIFADGITTLSHTTAETYMGMMLSIVIAGLTKDGRRLFKSDKSRVGPAMYLNMLEAFEMLLAFWAWLKKDKYWDCGDAKAMLEAEDAACKLMSQILKLWPREKGQGWEKPKFHETRHYAFNIHMFGKVLNWHSGPQEHNHIDNVKNHASATQKRVMVFDWQLANRLVDKYVIDYAHSIIQQQVEESAYQRMKAYKESSHGNTVPNQASVQAHANDAMIAEDVTMAGKFTIRFQQPKNPRQPIIAQYWWKSNRQTTYMLDATIVNAVAKQWFLPLSFKERKRGLHVYGYTEYHRDESVFRAHPNYRNEGPWYDYALLTWEQEEEVETSSDNESLDGSEEDYGSEQETQASLSVLQEPVQLANRNQSTNVMLIPAQLLCFVHLVNQPLHVLVHSCHNVSATHTVLVNRWRLEYENDKDVEAEFKKIPLEDEEDAAYAEEKNNVSLPQYQPEDDTRGLVPEYRMVSVDAIEKHCLMIPYHEHSKFLMQVIDQAKWGSKFLED